MWNLYMSNFIIFLAYKYNLKKNLIEHKLVKTNKQKLLRKESKVQRKMIK